MYSLNDNEVWIKDYEGVFSISTESIINKWQDGRCIRTIAQCEHSQGYLYCSLTHNGTTKNKLVHRLMAEAFIANPQNKKCVNHKNGNRMDNSLSNLEWVSYSENVVHAYDTKLNKHRKKVGQYDKEGKLIATYPSLKDAQAAMGKPKGTNISCSMTQGRCKTAYGYTWRYLNEEIEPTDCNAQ